MKDTDQAKKGTMNEKMETSSVKKRKRKARKLALKPKRLFQDGRDDDTQEQPQEAVPEPGAADEHFSEEEELSSDQGVQSPDLTADSDDVDNDVFGGAFKYRTPEKKKKQKMLEDAAPSTAPTARSQGSQGSSVVDVSPGEAKAVQQVAEFSKKIEKRLLDCLPSQMNPFLACKTVVHTHVSK